MDLANEKSRVLMIFKEMDLVAEVGSEIDKIEDNNNQIEDVENMVEYNNDFQYVSNLVTKLGPSFIPKDFGQATEWGF